MLRGSNEPEYRVPGSELLILSSDFHHQVIGVGKVNMVWPGLNAPMLRGKEVITRKKLDPDPGYEQRLVAERNKSTRFRRTRLSTLERGTVVIYFLLWNVY